MDSKVKMACRPLADDHAMQLLDMPIELLARTMELLSVRDVACFEGVCASTQNLARCDRLWAHLYRRDFGSVGLDQEHTDAALYGRGFRWFYMLAIARQRKRPLYLCNGRYIHVVPSSDGSTCESGEWTVVFDEASATARLVLDGYATATFVPKAKNNNTKKVLGKVDENVCLKEGIWRAGSFVGPGRLVYHTGLWFRVDRYSALGACGQGELHHIDGDHYVGPFLDGLRDGFGTYRWPKNNECLVGEWLRGPRHGRCVATGVTCDSKTFAGQCSDGKYKGSGVMRDLDGTVHQSVFETINTTSVYAITRRPLQVGGDAAVVTTRTIYSNLGDGAWRADTIDAGRAYVRTDAKDAVRITRPASGDAVIGGPAYMILTAVGDVCDDNPRLAGRRIWGHAWTKAPDTKRSPLAALPADPCLTDARLWAAYLASSQCLVDADVAAKCRASLLDAAEQAGVSLEWRPPEDDCPLTVLGLGLPFGRLLTAADLGSLHKGEEEEEKPAACGGARCTRAHEKQGAWVRCFLSGTIVPAADCDFLASGRLYVRDRLDTWFLFAGPHRATDPETGDDLCVDRDWRLPWCAWMACVPPDLLDWAVRDAAVRYPKSSRLVREHVRAAAASITGALHQRRVAITDPWLLMASNIDLNVPGCSDDRMVVGFDGLTLTHVEWRNSTWEPRGPWRLGAPTNPPVDPTVQPFEAPDRDPTPAAYLFSHGVINADLKAVSFVGSRLVSIYFFGQQFDGASFAGATLTACAFVGCRFRDTAFFGAVLGDCVFYDCLVIDSGHPAGQSVDRKAILGRIRSAGFI
ncbi:Morn repeat incomplete domain containing protein [Pandoravirus neocaledonia]|uniref:Morn repeat incomplete domain containing protein n=1 Tax=Pandoravirus neocaledonia TaxID=2107708 RepID=A0A2U7UB14_9VIRU|nr:Morn repeat incomplete domain containing protein [Pandoravirus neocaledonia]AVK75643.1 Morn repeat incomplete domain containing protein [Pandoravirus neocaledonia]